MANLLWLFLNVIIIHYITFHYKMAPTQNKGGAPVKGPT